LAEDALAEEKEAGGGFGAGFSTIAGGKAPWYESVILLLRMKGAIKSGIG
jgi:hypothetical protein